MKNYVEALQFKLKCSQYHYDQALDALDRLNKDNLHIFISEFSAMMEVMWSSIQLARACAMKQSEVDVNTFMKTLEGPMMDKLNYINQWIETNRVENVFLISDYQTIHIKPILKRRGVAYFEERSLIPYFKEVKVFADEIIDEFMKIYDERSSVGFDQSW
jgi:hypothetical protein